MQNKLKLTLLLLSTKKILFCKDTFILLCFLLGAGVLSVWLEQDLNIDFQGYHYYNGFAFLNNRLGFDIAPAQIGTYYNPLLDAVLYILDNTFSKNPFLFIMGLPAGLALFIVYKIADLFFNDKKALWISLSLLIALTGFAFFRQIGTCTHEITLACFVLGALYILLKTPIKPVWYFIAGALLGAAAGLKLTAALYCISTGLTVLLFYKTFEKPKTFIGLFILGGLTGFLTTNGFWMWMLWKNFQNPFFPFWNKIFKSPYFYDVNYVDRLHLSYDIKKLLFLPFWIFYGNIYSHKSSNYSSLTSNLTFSDARWMIGYILLIVFAFRWLLSKNFRKSISDRNFLFLTTFMFISYTIWLLISQNIRFTIPVEMLFGIVFIKILSSCSFPKTLFKQALAGIFIVICFYVLISTPLFSQKWGYYHRFSFSQNAVFPKNALILTGGGQTSYLAAKLAERTNARIISKFFVKNDPLRYSDFADVKKFQKEMKEILDNNFFPIVIILDMPKEQHIEMEGNMCFSMKNEEIDALFYMCSKPRIMKDLFWR